MLFDDWLSDELEQQRRRWSRKRFITPVYSGIAALICAKKQLCHTLILIMVFLIISCSTLSQYETVTSKKELALIMNAEI